VQGLLGSSSGGLQIGLNQTFTGVKGGGNELRAGYFVAIAASEQDAEAQRMWVVNDHLRIGDSVAESKPYTKAAYMLFRMEIAEEHENYEGFKTIQGHVDQAYRYLGKGSSEEAAQEMKLAASEVLASHDLTAADRTRLITVMKKAYDARKKLVAQAQFQAAAGEPTVGEQVRAVSTASEALDSSAPEFGAVMQLF
jgi:hypothetical protein